MTTRPSGVPHLVTATDPTTGETITFDALESATPEEAAAIYRLALAKTHPGWTVTATPNPAKPVGIVSPDDGPMSMVHFLTCMHWEGRDDPEEAKSPRSDPMTVEEAQEWVNREDSAVCLTCKPPVSEQAGRRTRLG